MIADMIPVVVRIDLTDVGAHELTVVENSQREDLSPLEEAAGYKTLRDDGMTLQEIADRMGRPLTTVARRLALCELSAEWRKAVADEGRSCSRWPAKYLEEIARLPESVQKSIFSEDGMDLSANNFSSFTEFKAQIESLLHSLSVAPWPLGESYARVKACTACGKRSGAQTDLFADLAETAKGDQCLDESCWAIKLTEYIRTIIAANKGLPLVSSAEGYDDKLRVLREKLRLPGVLDTRYECCVCKEGAKGAEKALCIWGPKLGKIIWITRAGQGSGSSSRGSAGSSGSGEPQKKSLKEKKEGLQKRRTLLAAEKIKALLEAEIKKEPKYLTKLAVQDIFVLCCYFGAATIEDVLFRRGGKYPGQATPEKKAALSCKPDTANINYQLEALRGVVLQVIGVISQTITYKNTARKFLEDLCRFLRIDFALIKSEVEQEIPVPRAWAREEELAKLTEKAKEKKGKKKKV